MIKWRKKMMGFTLVEMMIVVLIIGILAAIAIPGFMRARQNARARACMANLKQINAAVEQWAMDNNKASGSTPTDAQLAPYLDVTAAAGVAKIVCPECNTRYTITAVGTRPDCPCGKGCGGTGEHCPPGW